MIRQTFLQASEQTMSLTKTCSNARLPSRRVATCAWTGAGNDRSASIISLPTSAESTTLRLYTRSKIDSIFETHAPHLEVNQYIAPAAVFPMRVNNYVLENLIDW